MTEQQGIHIEELSLEDIRPYENNPRQNDNAVEYVAESIRQFGFKVPIIVDADGIIVAGHTRYKAAKLLKLESVPCIRATDLTPEQVKAFRMADNRVSEFATWDMDLLMLEIDELAAMDYDISGLGFSLADLEAMTETASEADALLDEVNGEQGEGKYDNNETPGALAEKYIVPPFSILDSRQGYWQDRKRKWSTIIHSGDGRGDELLGSGLMKLAEQMGSTSLTGTSIFDPCLAEILLTWFCPQGGNVIDPFAGGSVRGLVSSMLGHNYTGIDLSAKQIEANKANWNEVSHLTDHTGQPLRMPKWLHGDSINIDRLAPGEYDFMLACPPYADLEVYSDDPRDISNMEYPQFREAYSTIIRKTVAMLKPNAFAAIVVGEVRDKQGHYYNFVGDTINAFKEAGAHYYNECILLNMVGTGSLRAKRTFESARKVVKMHQNVLVFLKGDAKQIDLQPYKYEFEETEDEAV